MLKFLLNNSGVLCNNMIEEIEENVSDMKHEIHSLFDRIELRKETQNISHA